MPAPNALSTRWFLRRFRTLQKHSSNKTAFLSISMSSIEKRGYSYLSQFYLLLFASTHYYHPNLKPFCVFYGTNIFTHALCVVWISVCNDTALNIIHAKLESSVFHRSKYNSKDSPGFSCFYHQRWINIVNTDILIIPYFRHDTGWNRSYLSYCQQGQLNSVAGNCFVIQVSPPRWLELFEHAN